jgi:ornithine cyclodeaminase/alanine dehydrogenase-like protein (mu-crystallin family)
MTLLLTRTDADGLLDPVALADPIAEAFLVHATTDGPRPVRHSIAYPDGAFHLVAGGTSWFTTKVNAHFGQPCGITALFSIEDGALVALLDSAHLTAARTAAMTLVVLRALEATDARHALLVGAGRQGQAQAHVLAEALPSLETLEIVDRDPVAASKLAGAVGARAPSSLSAAARRAEVIVTVTPSRAGFLQPDMLRPGAIVCAYGADAPGKQELALDVLAQARVIVDVRAQALAGGELQHAARAGMTDVLDRVVELGDVLAGRAPARGQPDDVVVYDATGTALQDAVAAGELVAAASRAGRGTSIALHE